MIRADIITPFDLVENSQISTAKELHRVIEAVGTAAQAAAIGRVPCTGYRVPNIPPKAVTGAFVR